MRRSIAKPTLISGAREAQRASQFRSWPWEKRIAYLKGRLLKGEAENLTITLPGGNKISLIEAREHLLDMTSFMNKPAETIKHMLEKQEKQFNTLRDAVNAYNTATQKYKYTKERSLQIAAEKVGVKPRTLELWLGQGKRKSLPKFLSAARYKVYEQYRKPIEIKPSRYADFAYVLGSLLGNAYLLRHGVAMAAVDRTFVEELAKRVYLCTGHKVKLTEQSGRKMPKFAFISSNLLQMINRETNYLQILPKKYLRSKIARIEFAKAIYDSNGAISHTHGNKFPYVVYETKNQVLRDFIGNVLSENGIKYRNPGNKIIIGLEGLAKFKYMIGFRQPEKQGML